MNVYNIIIYIYIDIYIYSFHHLLNTQCQLVAGVLTHMNTAAHMAAVIQPTCSVS